MEPNQCEDCSKDCLSCKNITRECKECSNNYKLSETDNTLCELVNNGRVEIIAKEFDKVEDRIFIHFDHPILEKNFSGILTLKFIDESEGKVEGIQSNISLTNKNSSLEINMNVTREKFDGYFVLSNTDGLIIQASNKERVYFQEKEIRVDDIHFYKDWSLGTIKSVKNAGQISSYSFNIIFLISNPAIGFMFLRLMETFIIFRYINLPLPANIAAIFSIFDKSILDMIPNFTEKNSTGMGCKSHPKIIKGNSDCLIMNNGGGSYIIQPLGYFALKVIARMGMKISGSNRDGFVYKYSSKLSGALTPLFFFKYLMAIRLKFLAALFINGTYVLTKMETQTLINTVISLLCLLIFGM